MKKWFVLSIVVFLNALCFAESLSPACATVRVVDETGSCITGVIVRVFHARTYMELDAHGNPKEAYMDVVTDTNGEARLLFPNTEKRVIFRINGQNNEPVINGFYYDRSGTLSFTEVHNGQWQPWNAKVTHVIRPIINPIPMYARSTTISRPLLKVPELGKPYGFDLIKSDWTFPNGKGETSDLIFRLDIEDAKVPPDYYTRYPKAWHRKNMTFTVTFSRPDDGIQGFFYPKLTESLFRSPRFAPTDGYTTNLVCVYRSDEGNRYNDMDRLDQNYTFRIRSERDNSGTITNALYGKMYGPIKFNQSKSVKFTYYLNPTPNDRNLEYDPKRNLFKGVFKDTELPNDP